MRTWVQALAASALVVSMGLAATPTASAAGYGKPLPGEWWFTAWDIEQKVWPLSQGAGVTVAVIDSGVQASLPEFSSGTVLPGINGDTNSGDGRTDTTPVAGHGTGMAAAIAAQGTGNGYLGVAPKAKILPVTSTNGDSLPGSIKYAVEHSARVINVSRGTPVPCTDDLQNAVSYAIQHDVVVIASAGNEGDLGNASNSPANCKGVLAVGAVDSQLKAWNKTQRQPYVAVSAPGVATLALLKNGHLGTPDGTSSASALTAGVAALVRSKFPNMPARQVVQRIIASCHPAVGGRDAVGAGAVRPFHALADTVPASAPNPVFAGYDQWTAAHPQSQSAQPSGTAPAAQGDSGLPMQTIALGIGGVVVLALLIGGAVLVSRRR